MYFIVNIVPRGVFACFVTAESDLVTVNVCYNQYQDFLRSIYRSIKTLKILSTNRQCLVFLP
ncbi:hypothetical protein TRIATDRAFT_255125 [Trichoderma atroviride IMI 206040]|uniref:Uncharacterized protein n=1 Tax=Hypocrea atroviridis (strain ATCC 20476 / IMI 206040) TaxID=452589 RepID=G9NJN8_HYPAI|nr:uncharacterized protein TRIATDRAFT_255125 [Trichoderma atroviride IMI 206040]EHK49112.1 hypothetical protein TRIATDRAFT_255125 [Trichoderma atroviride IMI 206040]